MWRHPESSVVPDIMLRCPACGVEPAVFKFLPSGAYCDHCDATLTLESMEQANPAVAFPCFPEIDTYLDGARFAVTR